MLKTEINSKSLQSLTLLPPEVLAPGIKVFPVDFQRAIKPFEMTYFSVACGCKTPLDQHAVAECWLILQGNGILFSQDECINVAPLDRFYFKPFQPHQIETVGLTPLIICSIYWS